MAKQFNGSDLDWVLWLTLIFVGLKLFGAVTWPWVWVFAPLWLPVVVAGGVLTLAVAALAVVAVVIWIIEAVKVWRNC